MLYLSLFFLFIQSYSLFLIYFREGEVTMGLRSHFYSKKTPITRTLVLFLNYFYITNLY